LDDLAYQKGCDDDNASNWMVYLAPQTGDPILPPQNESWLYNRIVNGHYDNFSPSELKLLHQQLFCVEKHSYGTLLQLIGDHGPTMTPEVIDRIDYFLYPKYVVEEVIPQMRGFNSQFDISFLVGTRYDIRGNNELAAYLRNPNSARFRCIIDITNVINPMSLDFRHSNALSIIFHECTLDMTIFQSNRIIDITFDHCQVTGMDNVHRNITISSNHTHYV
jgi:hypothetical protein